MPPQIKFTRFEHASVIRKFTIVFVLMSILPLGILYYLYIQIKENGQIKINESEFNLTLCFVAVGILVGYLVMRGILQKLIDITKEGKETLEEVFGPHKFRELTEDNDEVSFLSRTFNEITFYIEEKIKRLESTKKSLHSVLTKLGQGISVIENINSFLDLIVETLVEAFSSKGGILLLVDEKNNEMYSTTIYGGGHNFKNEIRMKIDGNIFSSVLRTKTSRIISDVYWGASTSKEQLSLLVPPILCSPFILHDKVLGIIALSRRVFDDHYTEEDLRLLSDIASQTAVAVEHARLNENVDKTYLETMSALALAVQVKDGYRSGHLERVANYAVRIGKKLKLSEEDLQVLKDGARLHDIGKVGIVEDILLKPSQLNPREWEILKKHAEMGEGIVKPLRSFKKLCDVIRHHHERFDGTGYPDGLKGEEISLLARILSVADVFDALTSDRPYRRAFSFEDAKKELMKMKEKLDSNVVDTFLEILNEDILLRS